jgi:hypothetical protein
VALIPRVLQHQRREDVTLDSALLRHFFQGFFSRDFVLSVATGISQPNRTNHEDRYKNSTNPIARKQTFPG